MAGLRFTDGRTRRTEVPELTSLTLEEFQQMVPPFETAFQAHMAQWRFDGQPRTARRYTTDMNCPLPTPEDRFLCILVHLKTYALQVVHERLFEMGQSRANQWIHVGQQPHEKFLHGLLTPYLTPGSILLSCHHERRIEMDGLTIGEVAAQARVHVEALRYYERRGLIAKPPRSLSTYRRYPQDAVRRVRFIKRAQEIGFSLKDIKDLLSLRDAPEAECREIRRHAEAKVNAIDEKIHALMAMKRALSRPSPSAQEKGL